MNNWNELREKVMMGVKLAVERLIRQRAKDDEELVIMRDGRIQHIPAKQLLKELEEKKTTDLHKK